MAGHPAHAQSLVAPPEHDPEKWKPVFGQDHARNEEPKNLDRDPIQLNWIRV